MSAHARNFFDCVKSRGATAANPEVMRHSHIACHAAAMAWMLNRTLKFDPVKEEFIGDEEANGLRSRPARSLGRGRRRVSSRDVSFCVDGRSSDRGSSTTMGADIPHPSLGV